MDTHEKLIHRLRSADPTTGIDATAAAQRVVLDIARTARRKHKRALGILVVVGALGLATAAAIPSFSGFRLGANGHSVDVDLTIPITYQDHKGGHHECTVGIYVGSGEGKTAADEHILRVLREADWTPVGQRAYDTAAGRLAEGPHPHGARGAFGSALSEAYGELVPTHLLNPDQVVVSSDDCTGAGL